MFVKAIFPCNDRISSGCVQEVQSTRATSFRDSEKMSGLSCRSEYRSKHHISHTSHDRQTAQESQTAQTDETVWAGGTG